MNQKEKEALFMRVSGTIGFNINHIQCSIIYKLIEMIELKGNKITFEDIEDMIKPFVTKIEEAKKDSVDETTLEKAK